MIGQVVEFGSPVRIHGPIWFEVTTNPLEQIVAGFPFGNFDHVVNADDSHTRVSQLMHRFRMGDDGVARTTIGIHHNYVDTLEDALVLGPSVSNDFGL